MEFKHKIVLTSSIFILGVIGVTYSIRSQNHQIYENENIHASGGFSLSGDHDWSTPVMTGEGVFMIPEGFTLEEAKEWIFSLELRDSDLESWLYIFDNNDSESWIHYFVSPPEYLTDNSW